MSRRRPSIFQIGRVRDDGNVVTAYGWGLSLCASACSCHRDPTTPGLRLHEDQTEGLLGLVKHRDCDCCEPWTVEELASILRDLDALAAAPVAAGEEPRR